MPKPKRPPWFKMFLRHKALFEALSDEDAGVAIKAVMDYFESGQIARDVSPAVNVLVCAIKPDIDECADIYATRCENGKLGGRPKRSVGTREEPYGFLRNHNEPCRTEERRENSIMNEYGVLGSLLIDPSLFPAAAELPDDMFSSAPLQEIFRAMRRQYEESGGFDALTVRAEAGRNCTDVTDKLLTGLMDTTPTTANLDAYLTAVKEAALARSLRKIGGELITAL